MAEGEVFLAKIASAIKSRSCVIFFGSGVSACSGLPTGRELMSRLLEGQNVGESDLAIAAQVMRHRNGPRWLHQRLRTIFLMDAPKPNEIHKILALLSCKYYITTNYDLLFDSALKDFLGCADLPVVVNDEDIPLAEPVTYIKLHGDIAVPETIVLTYDDYDTRFEKNPNLLHLLYSLFSQNLVLFVGYSLSDSNVLSVVRKIGRGDSRYARGMYILVTHPDEEKADFFRSLSVNVVNIERRKDESEGAALQRFLLRLWNRMLDFDIYLNPEPREVSYANSLQIAIGSYRQASYHSADHLFEKLESAPKSVWSADPGLFAQYSYFKLKTLDKLNRWAEMEQAGQKLLAMLGGFDTVYPDPVLQSIRAQIHASIGLPLLRASFFEKAQSYILQALGTDPDDSIIGKDAMLLHADRHTVLACIELGLYLFGEEQDLGHLTAAERYLVKAGDLFRTYDDPDGPNEAHFLGRYFGACAFLRMVKVRYGGLPFSEPLSEELCQYSWMSYREIREGKNRVAYGKLAGHYCEAVTKSFLAGERLRTGDRAGAETLYAHSIKILEGLLAATDETVQICLSPLESCKFHRALELALRGLASMGTPELADRVTLHHDHFRQFASSEELRFMNAQVLAHESWILTPLN